MRSGSFAINWENYNLKTLFWGSAVALAVLGTTSAATADSAKTLGGLVIESDDHNFLFSLGGRIQFDYTGILPDKSSPFDSGAAENDSGFYFRRVFISLAGRIYGWRYRIDEDISNTSNPAAGFNDVYVSRDLWDYGTVRIGQTKPWRSLDELTSNNDIVLMNRNAVSAVGLLGGRDFQQGVFYRYFKDNALASSDSAWAGASIYSLNKAGATTDQGTGTPTQGIGYNARIAYAPIVAASEWLHVGASYSSDHADNGAKLTAGNTDWYSYKGVTQNVASLSGTQPATSPTQANIAGGDNPSAATWTGELSGVYGPGYFQGEIGQAKLRQRTAATSSGPNAQTVDAFSVLGSVYLTGESKIYNTDIATMKAPTPLHSYGALELAARYDFIKNHDLPAGNTTVCKPAVGVIPAGTTINNCSISTLSFGVNYYLNSAVRLMLDYNRAQFDLGSAGKDKPDSINARFQLAF